MTLPWFTDEELDFMCEGLKRSSNAARLRYLKSLGLKVDLKPNGKPLVWRPVSAVPEAPKEVRPGIDLAGMDARYARRDQRLQGKKVR